MLKKLEYHEETQIFEEDRGHLLAPSFYWHVLRRRWAYFLIPLIVVGCSGLAAVLLWPPTYLSAGKILVQAQKIPTELVRPTVTSAAQERIQMIEQRTMTRDNLVAIAEKFKLFPDKRSLMSVTELVELIKNNTKIAPVDLGLDFKQRTRSSLENPTIVFSIGFEYGDPAIATAVANELMTRILTEDLSDRTSRATDTTKFLAREVQKLQADNNVLVARIAQVRTSKPAGANGADQTATTLAQLRADLIQRTALYSDRHPLVQSLRRQIDALEKTAAAKPEVDSAASLDSLTAQQEALQKNLDVATARLDAAKLGENLEKDQQSEKLEVIEQPTVPQEPIRPKRSKLALVALAAAFFAGAGITTLAEVLDKGIRRGSDLFSVVDSHLIISIPYIVTPAEERWRRIRMIVFAATLLLLLTAGAAAAYFFLPVDLMVAKARVGLFR